MSTRTSQHSWPPGEIKCYFLNCTQTCSPDTDWGQRWSQLRCNTHVETVITILAELTFSAFYKGSGNTSKQQNRNLLASCNRFLALKTFGALSGDMAVKSKQTQKYKKQKSWKNNMKNCQEMQIKQNKMHNRNRCKAIKKIHIPLLTNKNDA